MPSGKRTTAEDRVSRPHEAAAEAVSGGDSGGDEEGKRRKEHISLLPGVSLKLAVPPSAAHCWSTAIPSLQWDLCHALTVLKPGALCLFSPPGIFAG
ncbi:hypothetical protein VZT92_014331 [Zoarces viviparus]|uniref:Uncharacterized protein n=1 Tax=Zoarces viviparus TaxID=48416 RepID=A0AAW1F297_ZOAVI